MTRACGCLLVILCLGSTASADDIKLKYNFWTGWKYCLADSQWVSVGMKGDGLLKAMADNPKAVGHMNMYRVEKQLALAAGFAGAGCIGYALAISPQKDKRSTRSALFVAGGTAWALGFLAELLAYEDLQTAVRLYNDHSNALTLHAGFPSTRADDSNWVIRLAVSF